MDGSDTYYTGKCTIYLPNRKRKKRRMKEKETFTDRTEKLIAELIVKHEGKGIKELIDIRNSLAEERDKEGVILRKVEKKARKKYDKLTELHYSMWDVARARFDSKAIPVWEEAQWMHTDNPAYQLLIAEDNNHYYWLSTHTPDCSLPYEIPKYLYEALLKFKSEYAKYLNQ